MEPAVPWYAPILRCPDCGGRLGQLASLFACSSCGFRSADRSPLDLRPTSPRPVTLCFERAAMQDPREWLRHVETHAPEITYCGPDALRSSREFMSLLAGALPAEAAVLDLGCGPRDQAVPLGHLGYRYVGLDFCGPAADLLGDAHALPFVDESFDCTFSYAVLEHLRNPFVALTEIARVLKPGGLFLGTVAQGEPFHDSYFHHTAWGVMSLVSTVEHLQVLRLWSSMDTLRSLADMGRYPRVIRSLLRSVDRLHEAIPFLAPRRMRWPESERRLDRLYRSGSICFLIAKNRSSREPVEDERIS
jgi:SAM-dependent methyltransferase